MNNRSHNSTNPHQGDTKKVLCVCSAGLLRSPTIASVLTKEPYNYNCRAVGYNVDFALIPVDKVLVNWADEIICADESSYNHILFYEPKVKVLNLNILDNYGYMDKSLIKLIEQSYETE